MSIFGTTCPKFISVVGSVSVSLTYAILEPKWPVPELLEQTSPLTGKKTFTLRGNYAEFSVLVHLSKFAVPATTASSIYTYHGAEVYFYPFSDGNAVKNAADADVPFLLLVESGFKDKYNKYDILKLTFKSTGYIDMINSFS